MLDGDEMTGQELVEQYEAGARNFRWANLNGAYLSDADLRGADLRVADLRVADLSRANLSGADLSRANLNGAYLSGADLRGANIDYSAWPLWCGSVGVKIDSKISRQLVYHALCNMPQEDKKEFLSDPFAYANTFHRIDECGVIK